MAKTTFQTREATLYSKLMLSLLMILGIWLVSGIVAAFVLAPNFVARLIGESCYCPEVLLKFFGFYVALGKLEVNLVILAPFLVVMVLSVYGLLKVRPSWTSLKRTLLSSLILSIVVISAIVAYAYAEGTIGARSPVNFAFTLTNGSRFELLDFKGKVLVLEFISPFCPACADQVRTLRKIAKAYPEVAILSISIDPTANMTDLMTFNKDFKVTWLSGIAEEPTILFDKYDIRVYPHTLLIDEKWRIREVLMGFTEEEILKKHLDSILYHK